MRPFDYARATDPAGAVALVGRPDAKYLAGGTNLVDLMKLGVETPALLVDVARLLPTGIEESADGLRIGAGARNSDVAVDRRVRAHYPVLSQALLAGASGQLRNAATIGGNLLQRTRCRYFQDVTKPCNKRAPGTGCPAIAGAHRDLGILGTSEHCVATHPSDLAVALAALDAQVHLHEAAPVPLTGLYALPGDTPQVETVLPPGALITAVSLPPLGFPSRYRKVRDRASYAFAVASVAAALDVVDGTVRDVRIAWGGVAPRPWRAYQAERELRGGPATEAAFRAAADAELAAARPLPENAFKVPLVRNLTAAVLGELAGGPVTAIGARVRRTEGPDKVTGAARYAVEYPTPGVAYVWPVQAPVARGTVRSVDTDAVLAMPGVLAVLWHGNAPRLAEVADHELLLFQSDRVAYHGQFVAAVVADSLEAAREAAARTRVDIDEQPHDTELRADRADLYTPEKVNPNYESDTSQGDVDAELAASDVAVDVTYETAATHNNPMEPHASTAQWLGDRLLVHDSNQGATGVAQSLATLFGLAEDRVQVVSAHVGGGFGAKGTARPNVVLAAMAARVVGRPVRLALSRQHQFSVVGYRTPTIQRIRLGAGADGVLRAISHEAIEQTSTVREFAEQTAVGTRMMYAAAARRTAHKLARLDVPTPAWMRAPGEAPGMYALESALDELAVACGLDPIELRVRNEPAVDPESGHPFSSRNLVACLRDGADRFGWAGRDPRPGVRRDGRWLVGTGVAAATYPARSRPASAAARMLRDGRYRVDINATDIGTGARTVLGQVAADALGVAPDRIEMCVGDSTLPPAILAGGSMGTASWSWAVDKAARELRTRMAAGVPEGGLEVRVDTADDVAALDAHWSRHAFGAHFAEVRVDADTGEVRVSRLLGVYAVGRVVNPTTARSQFLGGMTMGLGMALTEESTMDHRFGDYVNDDFAGYHVPACADVGTAIDAYWLEEQDRYVNPLGIKGIGEIGIVGVPAAIGNAVWHATGVRVRDLPIRLDKVLFR